MNNKLSHLKGLQRTTPDRLRALSSTWYTSTLFLPPTTIPLFLWLRNKIRFANVVGTQITRFLIKMNHTGLQRTTPGRLGAQTLCVTPTTFLFLWLQDKIYFAVMTGTHRI